MPSSHAAGRPDEVAHRLQLAIRSGEFSAQQALPSERELSARWNFSRSIIREGIAMLVAKGTLIRQHGRGTFINDAEHQLGDRMWAEMASLHDNLQGDLLEFRHVLECAAAELAAERHDKADARHLAKAGAAVEIAWLSADRKEQLKTDVAFHQCIAEATHNQVFSHLMASLQRLLFEHMQLSQAGMELQSSVSSSVRDQHRQLLGAILARDPLAAGKAAGTHLDFVRVRLNHMEPRRAAARAKA
jgi:GntR family transcriptional repressor for pyruvate dehydrogenase complex